MTEHAIVLTSFRLDQEGFRRAILGKLITLPAPQLVAWRLLLVVAMLALLRPTLLEKIRRL